MHPIQIRRIIFLLLRLRIRMRNENMMLIEKEHMLNSWTLIFPDNTNQLKWFEQGYLSFSIFFLVMYQWASNNSWVIRKKFQSFSPLSLHVMFSEEVLKKSQGWEGVMLKNPVECEYRFRVMILVFDLVTNVINWTKFLNCYFFTILPLFHSIRFGELNFIVWKIVNQEEGIK